MQIKYILFKPFIVNNELVTITNYSYYETPITTLDTDIIQSHQRSSNRQSRKKSIDDLIQEDSTKVYGSIDFIYTVEDFVLEPSLIPEQYRDKQIMIAYMSDEFDFNKWVFDQHVSCELIDASLFHKLLKTSSRYMDKYKELMKKRNETLENSFIDLNGYTLDANDKSIHRTTAIIVASLAKIIESIAQNNPDIAAAIQQINDNYIIKFKDYEDNFIDLKPCELIEAHYKMLTNLQALYDKYQMIVTKK